MSRMTKDINKITRVIIGISGRLILYAVILLLLVEGVSRGYEFGHEIFYATPMEAAPGTDRVVRVVEGESENEVAEDLQEMGLIDHALTFRFLIFFYDYEIQPGTYTLNTSMTSKEMLQILNTGPEEDTDD
ncbi:MAG: endolytic transglycosylase MltG [Clostridiales bacterium]|nr:endolytic transglycosylase MltG [Clostridiales bacterium]